MIDLSTVFVPAREAKAILECVRPTLVAHLVNGMKRKDADALVANQLRKQDNILSPYADEVVSALVVTDDEIEFRRWFGEIMAKLNS